MQGIAFAVIVAIGLAAVAYFASVQRPLTHGPADSSDYEPRNSWTPQRESTGCAQQRKKKKKNTVCPICLEKIVPGPKVKELQCDHWLHNDCAMRWFNEPSSERAVRLCLKMAEKYTAEILEEEEAEFMRLHSRNLMEQSLRRENLKIHKRPVCPLCMKPA